jgi:dTDP-glucose 4,6-dehydratase
MSPARSIASDTGLQLRVRYSAAFLSALDSGGGIGQVANVGSDFEVSIGDMVQIVADVMGVGVEVETDDERLRPEGSEVERLWASNEKARRLLGWEPAYGGGDGFRRGIGETVAWFSDPSNRVGHRSDRYVV